MPAYRDYPCCTITRVHDGDTFFADIDLGFRAWVKGEKFRLWAAYAPELKDAGGPQARDFLVRLISTVNPVVTLRTWKNPDKWGRWLADIRTPTGWASDLLVVAGHASRTPPAKAKED